MHDVPPQPTPPQPTPPAPPLPRRVRDTRAEILDAAHRVVSRDGAARLTLDAVAREVGLTKGGVLYHFASKAALLAAMLDRMVTTFDALAEAGAAEAAAARRPNPTLRGLIGAAGVLDHDDPGLHLAVVAVAAEAPEALAPVRAMAERFADRIEAEAADPAAAMMAVAVMDGLIFQRMMGMPPADAAVRAAVRARLDAFIDSMDPKA